MSQQSAMRPQDIVILLKKMTQAGMGMNGKDLAESLGLSQSEVSESLSRSSVAGLMDKSKKTINVASLREFLIYGLKYCFPMVPGSMTRGIPAASSAHPISTELSQTSDFYIWPTSNGTVRGQSVEPLYHTVPYACGKDSQLYELLAIADTLRLGRVREREIAIKYLDKYISIYGDRQH